MNSFNKNTSWQIIQQALQLVETKAATPEQVIKALCFSIIIIRLNEKIKFQDIKMRLEKINKNIIKSLHQNNTL